jgi:hypothetical protein
MLSVTWVLLPLISIPTIYDNGMTTRGEIKDPGAQLLYASVIRRRPHCHFPLSDLTPVEAAPH